MTDATRARPIVWIVCTAMMAAVLPVRAADPPNLAEALAAQRELAVETPTAAVLTDLGNLLVLADRAAEAESTYRRAIATDPDHADAPFNLGLMMQYRGEIETARELYLRVVALNDRHAWAHYQLGTILEKESRRQEAIQSYARALAIDPELFFADVNPQIVDNALVTEALLEAAKLRQPSRLAPMSFSRPREITRLLLSLPSSQSNLTAEETDSER
jgi:tetratricopeptide (TPR) repeat protein